MKKYSTTPFLTFLSYSEDVILGINLEYARKFFFGPFSVNKRR